ncbi:MAG: adenosine kinase [Bacteroidales bacterium]|nr:adenosine kinase [Bacteroidales bacterium]MBQ7490522.1 adenosine kinase [Bacteroidales bacterium]
MKRIIGVGNALVDVIVQVDDEDILKRFNLKKGGMEMVDAPTKRIIHTAISNMKQNVASGGSTSNTMHGLAHLGAPVGYIGKISKDAMGDFFEKDLIHSKINPHLVYSDIDTGIATTFITKDAERTFATYLGAASELTPDDIDESVLDHYDLMHIEGYLIYNHELILRLCKLAKKHGLQISMDMASYNLMDEHRDFMFELLENYVDIVFGNELEAKALTETDEEESLEILSRYCPVSVVKLGAKGSIVKVNGHKAIIQAVPSECVDTNGLGDIYASGFLFGLMNNYPITETGWLASFLAARLSETVGAKLSDEQWEQINNELFKR